MTPRNILSNHLATRANSLDFYALGMLLPNPDTILRSQGKSITTYRDMQVDALVGSCVTRRKASVQALDFGLDRGQASSRHGKAVQAMLDALPLSTIIEQMQDAVLYGYQPMEVIWGQAGGLFVPADVKDHPYWGWTAKAINTLFFWQPDHCRKQWEREQAHPLTGEMLPRDKVLHFFAGVSIAMVAGFVLSPWHGLLMAAGTGLVKELYDRLGPGGGTVDVWDFWVTCFGGGAGAAFLIYV